MLSCLLGQRRFLFNVSFFSLYLTPLGDLILFEISVEVVNVTHPESTYD